jgi:hypothetical protein
MTIDDVATKAKENLVRYGELVPTLLIDGTVDSFVYPLLVKDYSDRVGMMQNAGVEVACTHNVGKLNRVFLVTEAWMSRKAQGERLTHSPSRDPKRKEIVLIACFDVLQNVQTTRAFEIVRDTEGNLAQLQSLTQNETAETISPLLPAFVQGYSIISPQ